jgi:hypothetical protein
MFKKIGEFVRWVEEHETTRSFTLTYFQSSSSFWVFDHDLGVGQFVNSVDEIDLAKARYNKTLGRLMEAGRMA